MAILAAQYPPVEYTVTFHDPATLEADLMQQLVELSILSRRGEVERGFSMTLPRLFDRQDTGLMLSVARDAAGTPQAFVQWARPETCMAGRWT